MRKYRVIRREKRPLNLPSPELYNPAFFKAYMDAVSRSLPTVLVVEFLDEKEEGPGAPTPDPKTKGGKKECGEKKPLQGKKSGMPF